MPKVLLTLICHRIFLLSVVFLAAGKRDLWDKIAAMVGTVPEVKALGEMKWVAPIQIFQVSQDPYLLANYWTVKLAGISPELSLVILSNLFLLLFLFELHELLSHVALSNVAQGAVILAILWPTSYELSLGSETSAVLFFATLTLRQALDNQWLFAGIALGFLALLDPFALGMLPLLLYMFWFFQRHFPVPTAVRNGLFFVVPAGVALFWKYGAVSKVQTVVGASALFSLYEGGYGWAFSHSYFGQALTLILLLVGAALSMPDKPTFMHRMIPLYMTLAMGAFTPFSALASRALLAGIALEGWAGRVPAWMVKTLQALLVLAGGLELFAVFSAG